MSEPRDPDRGAARVRVRVAVAEAWRAFTRGLGPLLLGSLVLAAMSWLAAYLARQHPLPYLPGRYSLVAIPAAAALAVGSPLVLGLSAVCLRGLRGERQVWRDLLAGFHRLGSACAAAGAIALVVAVLAVLTVGLMRLLAALSPEAGNYEDSVGMIAAVALSLALCVAVVVPFFGLLLPALADGMAFGDAARWACGGLRHNWGALATLGLLVTVVSVVLGGFLGAAGIIVALPWATAVMAVAYLQTTGEHRR